MTAVLRGVLGWLSVTLTIVVAVLLTGIAQAAAAVPRPDPCAVPVETNHLAANATQPGVISLFFYNAKGSPVVYFECLDKHSRRLGSRVNDPGAEAHVPTVLQDATTWSCGRLVRRFAARSKRPDGTFALGSHSVRTVSCAQRFRLELPTRVQPGSVARIRVVDRWNIGGVRPQLCVTPPQQDRDCTTVALAHAVALATRRLRASARGSWQVELRVRNRRVRHGSFAVGGDRIAPRAAPPTVLATGDSTMQGIDSFLADELGDAATVESDTLPGSGVSRGNFWGRHAVSQTKHLRQSVSVISVGAATDGVTMSTPGAALVACCDEAWVAEYSRRVRRMMRTYLRRGKGRVFWLTPPLPRHAPRASITDAVNAAVERAAEGLSGVTVIRVDRIFSPHGYRDVIRYRGRNVRVRDSDGIHLNISGTAIVAKMLAKIIVTEQAARRSR